MDIFRRGVQLVLKTSIALKEVVLGEGMSSRAKLALVFEYRTGEYLRVKS